MFALFLTLIFFFCSLDARDTVIIHKKPEQMESVRVEQTLCVSEQLAKKNRQPRIKKGLEQFLGYSLADDEIPSIALVGSGGGFRAATIILSAIETLEELALLDIFSYVAALSGSSWGVSAWIAHTLSPAQLLTLIIPRLGFIFSPHHFDLVGVTKNLFSSYLQNRELPSLTDFCGNTVGCIYLGTNTDSRLSYKLSDMAPDVVSGKFPIPLFVTVHAKTQPNYEWISFSPFEVELIRHNISIPAQSLDRSMPQLMGLFGSAFAANFIDVMFHMDYPITDSLISKQWLTTRLCMPTIPNFTKGVRKSPFCYDENLYPVDAGCAFNIPFPPLLTRNINLYIVCDGSAGDPESVITKCEEYAKRHNYLFPPINHKMLYLPKISIFADKNNPYVPVIIYIPHRSKLSFFSFTYDKKDLWDTVTTTHDIITDYAHIIKEGIELAIKNQQAIKALRLAQEPVKAPASPHKLS